MHHPAHAWLQRRRHHPSTQRSSIAPCSGLIANEPTLEDPSVQQLAGNLAAGYIVADVPITVVVRTVSRRTYQQYAPKNLQQQQQSSPTMTRHFS